MSLLHPRSQAPLRLPRCTLHDSFFFYFNLHFSGTSSTFRACWNCSTSKVGWISDYTQLRASIKYFRSHCEAPKNAVAEFVNSVNGRILVPPMCASVDPNAHLLAECTTATSLLSAASQRLVQASNSVAQFHAGLKQRRAVSCRPQTASRSFIQASNSVAQLVPGLKQQPRRRSGPTMSGSD